MAVPRVFHSHSIDETAGHGARVAKEIKKTPALILLNGTLGAGKTEWTKGFINEYLNKETVVTSPSYSIVNSYGNKNKRVYHVDLYRIDSVDDLESIGFWDLISAKNVVIVEWGKRLPFHWPEDVTLWEVDIEIISESERHLTANSLFSRD